MILSCVSSKPSRTFGRHPLWAQALPPLPDFGQDRSFAGVVDSLETTVLVFATSALRSTDGGASLPLGPVADRSELPGEKASRAGGTGVLKEVQGAFKGGQPRALLWWWRTEVAIFSVGQSVRTWSGILICNRRVLVLGRRCDRMVAANGC